MSAEIKAQAFAMFLKGHSLRSLVSSEGPSRATLERWCKKENWVERRRQYQQNVVHAFQSKGDTFITSKLNDLAVAMETLLREALAESAAYNKGHLSKRQRKYTTKDIANLAVACAALPPRITEANNENDQ